MRKFLLTALLLTGLAGAVGTPANTSISNVATLDLNDGVTSTQLTSTPVVISVQQVYGVNVTPDGTTTTPGQTVTVFPGQTGTLTYVVTNTGNGTDTINLSALAANATAQGANIVGIYVDTNSNGTFDAGTDTLVTSLTGLAADATRTIFVRYTVPSGTTGGSTAGSQHQLNVTGTSAGDTTKVDNNNVGQFTVNRAVDMTLGTTQTTTVVAGATATFTDTLTNTSNAGLPHPDVTATVGIVTTDKTGAAITNPFTVTYTVTGPAGTFTNTDLETALNSAIGATPLPAGGTVTITPNVTPTASYKDGDKITLTIETYSAVTASSTVQNNAAQGDTQGIITNTVTAQRGVGTSTKTVGTCTAATTCQTRAQSGAGPISAKPGDYVVYYLTAQNTGTGNLFNVRLSDQLPSNFVPTSVGATVTGVTGTLKFSVDGSTWVTDVTTLGTLTGGATTLYVAIENGGVSTTITTQDVFTAGGVLRMKVIGYIRKDAVTGSSVTRDDTGL